MLRRIQKKATIAGDLAGTQFRTMMQRQANQWGVLGWVRFTDDGGAEAVFQSDERTVSAMARWCERGPMGARVTAVELEKMGLEAFSGFDVRLEAVAAPPGRTGAQDKKT